MISDFRSDTVTKPSNAMREAMMLAEVGDDVFSEDPQTQALEAYSANLFGHEKALFCPSGTMTNQLAVNCHTQPMDEILLHKLSHIYNYENAGYSFHSGVGIKLLDGERGIIKPDDVVKSINPDYDWLPRTKLLCLENTVNKAGGSIYGLNQMKELSKTAHENGLLIHLDGARLFNALKVTGDSTQAVGPLFDSISICLSKGLGAPIGSLLIGDAEFIKEARRRRKAFGGGMRQTGMIAAAGLFALKHNIDRLEEDHKRAKTLAEGILKLSFVSNMTATETNIVMFETNGSYPADKLINDLDQQGVRTAPFGENWVRMCTHLDLDDRNIDHALDVLQKLSV
jgi:threonine aldolase